MLSRSALKLSGWLPCSSIFLTPHPSVFLLLPHPYIIDSSKMADDIYYPITLGGTNAFPLSRDVVRHGVHTGEVLLIGFKFHIVPNGHAQLMISGHPYDTSSVSMVPPTRPAGDHHPRPLFAKPMEDAPLLFGLAPVDEAEKMSDNCAS